MCQLATCDTLVSPSCPASTFRTSPYTFPYDHHLRGFGVKRIGARRHHRHPLPAFTPIQLLRVCEACPFLQRHTRPALLHRLLLIEQGYKAD